MKKLSSIILCIVMMLMFTSCGSESIATVDGESVDKAYFDYYFSQLKNEFITQLGDESWETAQFEGKNAIEYSKEIAMQSSIEDLIITNRALADGIELSSDDKKAMEQVKNAWISRYNGKSGFLSAIKDYGINEKQFDYMLEAAYYKNHLIEKYTNPSEDKIKEYYTDNIAKVKHILVFSVDPNTHLKLDEEKVAEAVKKASDILAQARSGADFDTLVEQYTDDQNVFYYVGEGYALDTEGNAGAGMVAEFETAALALNVGEVSDIVESAYGYHIIKRYENDDEMFEKSKSAMTAEVAANDFDDVLNNWKSDMKIEINEEIYNSYK